MQQHQVEVHFNEVMKRRLTSNLAATRAALGITKG